VLGLCGGYQMLGTRIDDPLGVEGPPRSVDGLGLLDVATTMSAEKRLCEATGVALADDVPLRGYEMHIGETAGPDAARAFARLADGRLDGAVSADGQIVGTYLHGLFADDRQRARWLRLLGAVPSEAAYGATIERILDGLADHLAAHVDCGRLLALAR
jgi:adenosylcobyric acid synthase